MSSKPSVVKARHLADGRLAATLAAEDEAEDAGLDPLERITCRTHRRWLHHCISSPVHVIVVTGHRWCRSCQAEASVAVDELTGDVRVTCTRCGRVPVGRATRQIIRTCTASLAAALDQRRPMPPVSEGRATRTGPPATLRPAPARGSRAR
ncbi:hypothetical protein [Pseudonocardia acaciae]|uniref:hypothetical protein n=1 Tax=Pseudonocardia acaciae TaxID=551276 RepID=UPI001FDF844F|nr:hypothetical protein [Pseudonocardia acaciae]